MSLRTVLRLSLIAILVLIVAGPGAAQVPNPWRVSTAPMPRVKGAGTFEIEFGIEIGSGPVLFARGMSFDGTPTAAPIPREVPPIMIQADEEVVQVEGPGQLLINPIPASPPATLRPVPLVIPHGFDIARQSGNNPFSVQFLVALRPQWLPACNEAAARTYNLSLPQRFVVPRMTDRLDCGLHPLSRRS